MDEQTTYLGHFTVGDKEHAGQLVINGQNSKLEIYGDEFLHIPDEEMKRVVGITKDGRSITCVNCVGSTISGTATYYGKSRHFLELFPNFVVIGPRHFDPLEKEISELTFSFTKANSLFYDWGTFGHIIRDHPLTFGQNREILSYVRKAPRHRRRGGHLDLFFHWDRGPIIEVKAAVGTVIAYVARSYGMPSTSGIRMQGQVRINVKFSSPQTFEETLRNQFVIMEFFELVAQSKQNVTHISVVHKDAGDREGPLDLYMTHDQHDDVDDLQPTDALVNGGIHSAEFEKMLGAWLDTHSLRSDARRRFVEGFRECRSYDADRLVGAANAFDLLPDSDFGKAAPLPPEVQALISSFESQLKAAAKENPVIAGHKERISNLLGRVRGSNLRSKVLSRYAQLPDVLKDRLPGMDVMIAHAIQARNYLVHGSDIKFAPDTLYSHASFFTDTLEFIFAASELQLCGWDIERWAKEHFSSSRLKWYMRGYSEHAEAVNASIVTLP